MNLSPAHLGILLTPTIPLYTGTVVSYSTASDKFTLTVTPLTNLSSVVVGMCVDAGGELVRIKTINTGTGVLELAENGVSADAGGGFVAGATIYVYNLFYPMPKFQRLATDIVIEAGDTFNQLSDWILHGVTQYNSDGLVLHGAVQSSHRKVKLYSGSDREPEELVAVKQGEGNSGFGAKNGSGISGSVTLAFSAEDEFTVTITPYRRFIDYDIAWEDMGADNPARSKAEQMPIIIVSPACAYLTVNESKVFTAANSFATYNGWNSGARDLATIASYAWDAGAGGTVTGAGDTVSVAWSTVAHRHLKVTVTDSNSVASIRYIPVWVGIAPNTDGIKCSITETVGEGMSAQISMAITPTHLRHSLVCVVDLQTSEPIFLGYIWPEDFVYNFEQQTLSFTALTAFSFLKHLQSYPFRLAGVKGDPTTWDYFDMNSVPRGVYFLLRWMTNYLELANAQFDTSPEQRLEYIRDYTAGKVLEQLTAIADSAFYSMYGDAFGGFKAIPALLYGSAITGGAYEALTKSLLATNIVEPVSYRQGEMVVSEVRLSGFYYDANLDFFPMVVRAPTHPANWGSPTEKGGLIANGPGYAEMLRWAARHLGVSNHSKTYTVKTLVDVDLATYKMIDIPSTDRIVIDSISREFDPEGMKWDETITGRTFGITGTSIVEPVPDLPAVPSRPTVLPTLVSQLAALIYGYTLTGTALYDKELASPYDGAWGAETSIMTPEITRVIIDSDVYVDDDGNTYIVWTESPVVGGTTNTIYYSKRLSGATTWSAKEQVSDTAFTSNYSKSRIAVDDDGNVYVVWAYYDGVSVRSVMFSERSVSTGVWDADETIDTIAYQEWPDIVSDSYGNLYVIAGSTNCYSRATGVVEWTEEVISATGLFPTITIGFDDLIYALWRESDHYYHSVRTAGVWSAPEAVTAAAETISSTRASVGGIAADESGTIYVIWPARVTGESYRVKFASKEVGGAWSAPTDLSEDFGSSSFGTQYLSLALDSDSNMITTWSNWSYAGEDYFPSDIWGAIYSAGVWGAASEIVNSGAVYFDWQSRLDMIKDVP